MGDFPEPKYHTSMADVKDNTPVMTKIYSTLGRKFNKKDLEDAQRMGTELVSDFCTCNFATIIKLIYKFLIVWLEQTVLESLWQFKFTWF